jgi:ribosomal protein S18 acetylase RimI-like enzyme
MNIAYRKASELDYATLARLDKAAFCRDFDFALQNEAEVKKFIGDYDNWIVTCDETEVGYYSVNIESTTHAEIIGVVVIPEYQKKGIGSTILKRILDNVEGISLIKIVTHPKNIAAIKLYSNFGFEIVEYKENYYGDGQPRLVLNKKR